MYIHLSKRVSYHLIGWLAFLTYEIGVVLSMGGHASFFRFAAFYSLDIIFFYFNAHIVLKYAYRGRFARATVVPMMLLELAVFILAEISIDIFVGSVESGHPDMHVSDLDYIRAMWRGVYIAMPSFGYFFFKRNFENERKANALLIQTLESEKRQAELENARLRAQINPHLLFNSLNYIFNAVNTISVNASKGILLLADVMRYAMGEAEPDGKIGLAREVEQIENYITLNQLRFNNRLHIVIFIDEHCRQDGLRFPPLILLTFVENIFKHGYLTDPATPACISMQCCNGRLYFYCSNTKRYSSFESDDTHIGMSNIKTRLYNYYAEAFRLWIDNNDVTFTIKLTVQL